MTPIDQRSLSAHLPAAPSRRGCPRSLAADDYPRLIPPASLPHDRGCPRSIADELPAPRLLGVVADACGIAPRMISRFTLLGVEADACGIAPRMTSRFTLLGVEADACGIAPRMTSRAPTLRAAARAAEGALATLILTPSQSLLTVYAVIPDSDRAESAPWRESIPRGGAAHPERGRRVERGVAHVCQSVAHPPPPTTKGAA